MIIRILPRLDNRQQWIEFCRREVPYCFVEQPDTLVDFQSSHLVITLLNQQVRNGRDAVKYSIGSRQSVEPAWHFIKACEFSLDYMVNGLEAIEFRGNARDNSQAGLIEDVNIRKFFAKEQAVISPAFLGPLDRLNHVPEHWDIHLSCRILANNQFRDLRSEQKSLNQERDCQPDPQQLLIKLVENPDPWQIRLRDSRLWLLRGDHPIYSFIPWLETDDTAKLGKSTHPSDDKFTRRLLKGL
ncbi:MAG: hypothetical protein OQJ91_16480 [Motiliproteus sp.]|nr:hypothetical protein [Motiliproteus sp.]